MIVFFLLRCPLCRSRRSRRRISLILLGSTPRLKSSLFDAIGEGQGRSSSPCFAVADDGRSVIVLVPVRDRGFLFDCGNRRIREEDPPLPLPFSSSTSCTTTFEDTPLGIRRAPFNRDTGEGQTPTQLRQQRRTIRLVLRCRIRPPPGWLTKEDDSPSSSSSSLGIVFS